MLYPQARKRRRGAAAGAFGGRVAGAGTGLPESGTLLLLLTGGEPFLRPDFREIYTGCRRLGLMVSINTNGHPAWG